MLVVVLTGLVGRSTSVSAAGAPPPVLVVATTPVPARDAADSTPAGARGGNGARAAIVAQPSPAQQRQALARLSDPLSTHVSRRWMEGFYPIYSVAQSTFGVNWLLIASIHEQESAFSTAPGTYHGLNFAHCCGGPMQFNVTNGGAGTPSTWDLVSDSYIYGRRPASYDHMTATHPSIYDDFDAIMAAAHLLSADGATLELNEGAWDAAYDYYGHDAAGVAYADQVLARAIGWSQHGFCINCGVEPAMVRRCTPPTARRCSRRCKPPKPPKRRPGRRPRACGSGGLGRARLAISSPATRSLAPPVPPSRRRESCERRKYSGASCSQVAPMPPCTEIIVRAA